MDRAGTPGDGARLNLLLADLDDDVRMETDGAHGPSSSSSHELEILAGLVLSGSLSWALPVLLPRLLGISLGVLPQRGAWGSGVHCLAALPLMMVAAGLGGFSLGGRSGRVVLALMAGHLLAMLALVPAGVGEGLMPATLVLLVILALLQLAVAALAGRVGRRRVGS